MQAAIAGCQLPVPGRDPRARVLPLHRLCRCTRLLGQRLEVLSQGIHSLGSCVLLFLGVTQTLNFVVELSVEVVVEVSPSSELFRAPSLSSKT